MINNNDNIIPQRPFSEKELNMADLKNRLACIDFKLRGLTHNTQPITADKLQDNYNRQVEIKKLRHEKADLLFTIHTL